MSGHALQCGASGSVRGCCRGSTRVSVDWRKRMTSFSGPVSRLRRRREMAAVTLFVCVALGSFALLRPTSETGAPSSSLAGLFIGTRPDKGWVDDFARLAARAPARPVVLPETDSGSTTSMPEAQTAALATSAPIASSVAPAVDLLSQTSSVRPARGAPLLPPVPDADAFKVRKGDRLLNQPHPLQGASTDVVVAPHAMLAPVRQPRGNNLRLASAAMKPVDLAPRATPDAVFQGPPLPPADPAIDPNAPVLGFAEQGVNIETPFRAVFAVSPSDKRSWLEAATEKTVAKKPVKKPTRAAARHRRHHNG